MASHVVNVSAFVNTVEPSISSCVDLTINFARNGQCRFYVTTDNGREVNTLRTTYVKTVFPYSAIFSFHHAICHQEHFQDEARRSSFDINRPGSCSTKQDYQPASRLLRSICKHAIPWDPARPRDLR